MASEIRVNKINSRTGVGTITLSPTGVDFTGIATVATLKATTGIVTTLTATGDVDIGGDVTITGGFLHIKDNTSPAIRLQDNNNANSDFKIYSPDGDNQLRIYHENTSSDLVTITSGGNVGIGTAAPTVLLDLESSSPTIRLTDSDATGTPECQISGGGGDLVFEADRDNEKSDSLIRFAIDGSERMRILSTGGITFNADTAAANALDDYEEGTFNAFANVASSFTGETTRTSRYTRIGNMVYCDLRVEWTGTTGSSGLLFDLPFAQAGTTGNASGHTGIVFYEGTSVDASAICTHVSKGHSTVSFFRTDGGNFSSVKLNNVNGSYDWVVSFSYLVA